MSWLTVVYAFAGCLGFCFIFHLRGLSCMLASLGGALGQSVYLLLCPLRHEIAQYFIAAVTIALYAEIMARINKKPATCYIIISVIPMVPGAGIYYTMKHCLEGSTGLFVQSGLHTLGIAGALAMGILSVISLVRLLYAMRKRNRFNKID